MWNIANSFSFQLRCALLNKSLNFIQKLSFLLKFFLNLKSQVAAFNCLPFSALLFTIVQQRFHRMSRTHFSLCKVPTRKSIISLSSNFFALYLNAYCLLPTAYTHYTYLEMDETKNEGREDAIKSFSLNSESIKRLSIFKYFKLICKTINFTWKVAGYSYSESTNSCWRTTGRSISNESILVITLTVMNSINIL